MTQAPNIFLITDHLYAKTFSGFLTTRFGGAIELHNTFLQAINALRRKTPAELNQIGVFATDRNATLCYADEVEILKQRLGEEFLAALLHAPERGKAIISHVQQQFASAGERQYFIRTITPEYLTRERMPEGLTGVITSTGGRFTIQPAEKFYDMAVNL